MKSSEKVAVLNDLLTGPAVLLFYHCQRDCHENVSTFQDKSRKRLLRLKVESLKLGGDGEPLRTREGFLVDLGGPLALPPVNISSLQ